MKPFIKSIRRLFFLLAILSFIILTSSSDYALDAGEQKINTYKILDSKCIKCHGRIKNGKKKIKGNFDLSALMNDGIQSKDSILWAKVIEQIELQNMPPEDSVDFSEQESSTVLKALYESLARKELLTRPNVRLILVVSSDHVASDHRREGVPPPACGGPRGLRLCSRSPLKQLVQ